MSLRVLVTGAHGQLGRALGATAPAGVSLTARTQEHLDITREDFSGGTALFVYDFTPAGNASSGYAQVMKKGSVNLFLTFGATTNKVYNIVLYGEFDNSLDMDTLRHVVYDVQG